MNRLNRLYRSVLVALSLLLLFPLNLWAGAQPVQAVAGIQLVRSDEQGIVLILDTPDYSVEDVTDGDGPCRRVHVPGYAQGGETGAPQLPVKVSLLGVPTQVDLILEVVPLETVTVSGRFSPCPGTEAVAEPGEGEVIRYVERPAPPDAAVYGVDALYPDRPARLHEMGAMRSQRMARLELFPFQVNPLRGGLLHHRRLQVTVRFAGEVQVASAALGEEGHFEQVLAATLLNYGSARAWRGAPPVQVAANSGWTPPVPGYRVAVQAEGMYALSRADLAAAGLPVDTLNPGKLQMFSNGQEIAIYVSGGEDGRLDDGDRVIFYGQAVNEKYTGTNVYWLTYDNANGVQMVGKGGTGGSGAQTATAYRATVRLESNNNYVSSLPMQPGYDHWYGQRITAAGVGKPNGYDFTLTTDQVAQGDFTASLTVALAGNVVGTHHLRLYVNGNLVHDDSWTGRTYRTVAAELPQGYLIDGANTVRVELANDTPNQPFDMVYTDWLEIGYRRKLAATDNVLLFNSPGEGGWIYTVGGFTDQDVALFDVTNPIRISRITNAQIAAQDGGYALAFGDNQSTVRRYAAVGSGRYLSAASIVADRASDLLSSTTGADYLVIAHSDFLEALQPLVSYRQGQGYRVRLLDVQDIYDQFNYGRMSAKAIRDFLAYAYANWPAPAPSYVLLVGDGTYDPRRYLNTSSPTYLPPYLAMVDPDLGETASENGYVTVVSDDVLPDMYIGRLPAQTAADTTVMVSKIMGYETAAAADDWDRNVLFISDDLNGGGGAFYNFSNSVADGFVDAPVNSRPFLPDPYIKTKVYLGQTCPDENPSQACQQEILDRMNQGSLLVSYVGHGTKQYWAEEQLLNLTALQRLTNRDRLSIMLPMTCLEGYFQEAEAGVETFGETIVRMAETGAVASWSPTGFGLVTGHDYLEKGLFVALFHDNVQELGAATTQGKLYLAANAPAGKYDDLLNTYLLLGDPALRVRVAHAGSQYRIFLPVAVRGQ